MAKRILIVDDNQDNRELVKKILRNSGYELHEAADGQAALDLTLSLRPDLVLMDIQLPVFNGYEVVRRIRESPAVSAIPIIGLTSYAMKGDEEKVLAAGCDAYLSKPIDIPALREAIERLLADGNT